MSFVQKQTIPVETDGNGDSTDYSTVVTGDIYAIVYTKTDFAAGVDFVITSETTGQVIWSEDNVDASEIIYPRTQVQDTAGANLTLDGTRIMVVPVAVADERIKFVISNGGDTKTGSFVLIVK